MNATVYLLMLSQGSWDDYTERVLGVFTKEEKALITKASLETELRELKEATFKDTGWRHFDDVEEYQLEDMSKEELGNWMHFALNKSGLEQINRLWIEPHTLNEHATIESLFVK